MDKPETRCGHSLVTCHTDNCYHKLSLPNVGDKVHVEYDGTVTSLGTNVVSIKDPLGGLHVYKNALTETFERILPVVELGDVWQLPNGSVYVVKMGIGTGRIALFHVINRDYREPPEFFKLYPKAKLLYRLSDNGIKL